MSDDNIQVIPVKIRAAEEWARNKKFSNPFIRGLNRHFGFPPTYQLVFIFQQDLTFGREFPRFNIGIYELYAKKYLWMPEFDDVAHEKMQRFVRGQMIRPFTFMFSVTEMGLQAIRHWRISQRLHKTNPIPIDNA